MLSSLLVATCLASVIIMGVILAFYTAHIKKDFDNKMRSVVDQVNSSNYYQYELEKRSYDKLNSIDSNITNVRNKYLPKADINDKVVTNTLDVKDIIQHDGKIDISNGKIDFGKNLTIQGEQNNMNVNIPNGTSMNFKDGSGNPVLTVNKKTYAPNSKIDTLQLGDKFLLSGVGDAHGNDGWLRIFNKDGTDYNGGIAAANLWSRDATTLNGTTNINGLTNISGNLNIKGGTSEHNPTNAQTQFASKDNKNYIRGDTEMIGNTNNVGDLTIGRDMNVNRKLSVDKANINNLKVNHNWDGNEWSSPLSVYASTGAAIIAGGKEFKTLLPYNSDAYIRPGASGGTIYLGDIGNTSAVKIGDQNTTTKVMGKLCIQDTCITKSDLNMIRSKAGL